MVIPVRRMLTALFVATLAGTGAAACGSDRADVGTVATPSTSTTASTATSSTLPPLTGASTSPVSVPIDGHAKLTAVRVGNQGSFDRITFEFTAGLPGYSVQYIDRPVQADASGETVDVTGDNVLGIRFAGASGVNLDGGKVDRTYTGPKSFTPTSPAIAHLIQTGDFEDVLSWAAGVHGKPGFQVTTLSAPDRVVVDIAHP